MSESAYPGMEYDETAGQRYHYGLTKRELFAMAALQGLLANEQAKPFGMAGAEAAVRAVRHADALIAALEEK